MKLLHEIKNRIGIFIVKLLSLKFVFSVFLSILIFNETKKINPSETIIFGLGGFVMFLMFTREATKIIHLIIEYRRGFKSNNNEGGGF